MSSEGLDCSQPLSKVAPYPEPKEGQKRSVIYLPPLEDEYAAKVELVIGKTLLVDGNRHMLGGKLEEVTLQGWGYTYYVVENVVGPMSTLMFIPGPKTEQFVQMRSNNELVRYNSKLPIVVYTPADVEVRYRIWRADTQTQNAIQK
ncbi:ecotin precursor [Heterostelium album PN500]|uniref:Ecotin n=1 Tax=Heterostelium pallidum (strain ATCC 26659 / Pp 5 / PN500) TaxID=670386 RepID=D3AWF5_HETP5|nr:ecotin precursor [Heterostelium album PN500]EFA86628.1 ecotin precursor [Heterostelium album PN500]|eukprot:XP_020438733.1 ecotin precursor [Heterostelium album PN500]